MKITLPKLWQAALKWLLPQDLGPQSLFGFNSAFMKHLYLWNVTLAALLKIFLAFFGIQTGHSYILHKHLSEGLRSVLLCLTLEIGNFRAYGGCYKMRRSPEIELS